MSRISVNRDDALLIRDALETAWHAYHDYGGTFHESDFKYLNDLKRLSKRFEKLLDNPNSPRAS